jgi:hypothetical protein
MLVTFIVVGIVMGLIFGFALEKSRVFEPRMMVGLFQLRHFIVLFLLRLERAHPWRTDFGELE